MQHAQDFTIDAVVWHTRVVGNPETQEQILARFNTLVSFLQTHGLLAHPVRGVDEAFEIRASDLTEEGFCLVKAAYDPWLKRMARGSSPRDPAFLEKALVKLREGERRVV